MSADRNHAVPSAQPVRMREALQLLDDGQCARRLRPLRGERNPFQSRIAASWRDFPEPENYPRGGAHPPRTPGKTLPRKPGWRTRLGLRAGIRRRDLADVAAG